MVAVLKCFLAGKNFEKSIEDIQKLLADPHLTIDRLKPVAEIEKRKPEEVLIDYIDVKIKHIEDVLNSECVPPEWKKASEGLIKEMRKAFSDRDWKRVSKMAETLSIYEKELYKYLP